MLHFNFTPFPVLTTARLTLRRPALTDTAAFFPLRANPAVMQFIPRPLAQAPADATAVLQAMLDGLTRNESINWVITRRDDDDELLGMIGYVRMPPEDHRAEIGYLLNPAYQGQGLMQEALEAVVAYGFQSLHLHSIEAITDPANHASRRLLERNGFVQEGFFKENCLFEGRYLDSVVYSRLTPMRNAQ